MKVIAAPDSFKGSLSAVEAAAAIARGVRAAAPSAQVIELPLADGGEGTADALVAATGGRFVEARVSDPLGRPITARYGLLGNGTTAVVEMAAASGLVLLTPEERNPMKTSTFGTGQLILDAAKGGAKSILVGIGGSATVDGGTGMARALGVDFLDSEGRVLSGGGEILTRIAAIDTSRLRAELVGVKVTVASDVTNPLTGPQGAATVYGPQKGATPEQVAELDDGLSNLAEVIRAELGKDVDSIPGAGAAGGLGAGLAAFLDAEILSGIEIVLDAVDIDRQLKGADVVFTGEGKVDGQSACGKTAAGLAAAAAVKGVPVVLLAGEVGDGAEELLEQGVTALFSIACGPTDEKTMMAEAAGLLERAAEASMRTFLAGRRG